MLNIKIVNKSDYEWMEQEIKRLDTQNKKLIVDKANNRDKILKELQLEYDRRTTKLINFKEVSKNLVYDDTLTDYQKIKKIKEQLES